MTMVKSSFARRSATAPPLVQGGQRSRMMLMGAPVAEGLELLGSILFQTHLFQRRRPRVGVDQHQRRLGHARAHPARPHVLEDGTVPDALMYEALDVVQNRLPLLPIGLNGLLLEERVDIGIAAIRPR